MHLVREEINWPNNTMRTLSVNWEMVNFLVEEEKNQETNLARAGDTRWGSHHKTLCRLEHMRNAILEVLENIAEDGVGEKRTTASGLLLVVTNGEF